MAPYLSRSAMRSYWFQSAGRGPMIDILPVNILNICGNSSNDNLRRTAPLLVIHRDGSLSRCVGTLAGVSAYIVRNLGIMKVVLCIPTRFCQKKTGPRESNFTTAAISAIGTARITSPVAESIISIMRLM